MQSDKHKTITISLNKYDAFHSVNLADKKID